MVNPSTAKRPTVTCPDNTVRAARRGRHPVPSPTTTGAAARDNAASLTAVLGIGPSGEPRHVSPGSRWTGLP
ncbi:hypothetical protein OG244_36010 [Streptomyces brevispora]|uniref:hypothetical protein n=1 Tax=Streptomyces brevispora TaxID=887462 RepID=UPI002E373B0F|nr:hypothetical protein [Streptomyces brevispora]